MRAPDVELLWWDGCPSTERALSDLRAALTELSLDPTAIRTRQVRTDAEAAEFGFAGSPTILIDGVDIAGRQAEDVAGLTCRVYKRRDGRISPTPDPADLRDALSRAV